MTDNSDRSPSPCAHTGEHRRQPRIEAPVDLRVTLPSLRGPVTALDLSEGGVAILAHDRLPVDSEHVVVLSLEPVHVRHHVRVAHCRMLNPGRWVIGLRFTGQPWAHGQTVADLLAEVLARVVAFE
jgi:hypothetical protein